MRLRCRRYRAPLSPRTLHPAQDTPRVPSSGAMVPGHTHTHTHICSLWAPGVWGMEFSAASQVRDQTHTKNLCLSLFVLCSSIKNKKLRFNSGSICYYTTHVSHILSLSLSFLIWRVKGTLSMESLPCVRLFLSRRTVNLARVSQESDWTKPSLTAPFTWTSLEWSPPSV